jgi:hypothetical protein
MTLKVVFIVNERFSHTWINNDVTFANALLGKQWELNSEKSLLVNILEYYLLEESLS